MLLLATLFPGEKIIRTWFSLPSLWKDEDRGMKMCNRHETVKIENFSSENQDQYLRFASSSIHTQIPRDTFASFHPGRNMTRI